MSFDSSIIKILSPIDVAISTNSKYFDQHNNNDDSQTLIEQFKTYDKSTNDELLLLIDSDLAHGDYSKPNTNKVTSLNDIPLLTQTISNLFDIYCPKSMRIFHVNNQTIKCEFKPVIVRKDGLALVDIQHIEVTQIICNPPIHEKEGATLTSSKYVTCYHRLHNSQQQPQLNEDLPYNTLTLFDFSQIDYSRGNVLYENSISSSNSFTYTNLDSINPNSIFIIYVNGCSFC